MTNEELKQKQQRVEELLELIKVSRNEVISIHKSCIGTLFETEYYGPFRPKDIDIEGNTFDLTDYKAGRRRGNAFCSIDELLSVIEEDE